MEKHFYFLSRGTKLATAKKGKHKTVSFYSFIDEYGKEALAKKLRITKFTVTGWRRGKNHPRIEVMRQIKRLTKGLVTYEMIIDKTKRTFYTAN